MADNKDRFQERLNRIQAQREGATPPQQRKRTARVNAGTSSRWWRLALFGFAVAGVIGAGAYGVQRFNASVDVPIGQMLQSAVINTLGRTPTSDSFDGLRGSGPKERRLRDTGWELPVADVAAPDGAIVPLSDIALVAAPQDTTLRPEVVRFGLNTNCSLRRPRAGEVVRNVRLDNTARYTDTHVFSKDELADALVKRIGGLTRHARHYARAAIAEGRMGQVDVFVTDTSAPVYLVLQTFNRDVLWNIHLADGAELAHVAMIGNKSGFAAPQGDYTYEALRVPDFVEEEFWYDNAESRTCMVMPWRKAEADWPLLQKLDDPRDGGHYKTFMRNITQGYDAYNRWYQSQLGVSADMNLTSALTAAHALAGPIPASPIRRDPLHARTVYVAQNDYVAVGQAELEAMHRDVLLAATGGDLSILTPAPMEVRQ